MKIKLKNILEEKNLSAYKLSKLTDISAYNISQLANNKTNGIKFDTLEKICKALNCTIDDILEID